MFERVAADAIEQFLAGDVADLCAWFARLIALGVIESLAEKVVGVAVETGIAGEDLLQRFVEDDFLHVQLAVVAVAGDAG